LNTPKPETDFAFLSPNLLDLEFPLDLEGDFGKVSVRAMSASCSGLPTSFPWRQSASFLPLLSESFDLNTPKPETDFAFLSSDLLDPELPLDLEGDFDEAIAGALPEFRSGFPESFPWRSEMLPPLPPESPDSDKPKPATDIAFFSPALLEPPFDLEGDFDDVATLPASFCSGVPESFLR